MKKVISLILTFFLLVSITAGMDFPVEAYSDNCTNENGHSFNTVTVPPTSLDMGCERHTCAECGYSYDDNYTESFAANGEWVSVPDLKRGDVIQFGAYPQELVTDQSTIEALNNIDCTLASKRFAWKWYTDTNGSKDGMYYANVVFYADIEYAGNTYRKIVMTDYRPIRCSVETTNAWYGNTNTPGVYIPDYSDVSEVNRYQYENGYQPGTYYFKWEPVTWLVQYAPKQITEDDCLLVMSNLLLSTSEDITSDILLNEQEISVHDNQTFPAGAGYNSNTNYSYYRGRGTDYARCLGLKVDTNGFSDYWLANADEYCEAYVSNYDLKGHKGSAGNRNYRKKYPYADAQYRGNRPVTRIKSNAKLYRLFVNDDLYYGDYTIKNGVVFNQDMTELVKFANSDMKELVIPNSVTDIADDAFSNCNLERIIIQNNDLSIKKIISSLPNDITIYAYSNSNAATAATANNLNIEFLDNYNCDSDNHLASIYGVESFKKPTCTESGSTAYYCVLCDKLAREDFDIPALGHELNEGEVVTEATCTNRGLKRYTCSVCHQTINEVLEPTGHSWDTGTTIEYPSCETDGLRRFRCLKCGATNEVALNKTGHNYIEAIDGCVKHITCGNKPEITLDKNSYPESEHDYSAKTNQTWNFEYSGAEKLVLSFSSKTETESTYDNIYIFDKNDDQIGKYSGNQLLSKTITIDGDSFSIKLLTDEDNQYYGFSFDSIVAIMPQCDYYAEEDLHEYTIISNIASTCTSDGCIIYLCSKCGTEMTETIPATGHNPLPSVEENRTTFCTASGSYDSVTYCSVCGEEISRLKVIVPPTGHNYYSRRVEAHDGIPGHTEYVCSNCGDSYIAEYDADDSALQAAIAKAQNYLSDDYSEDSLVELEQLVSQFETMSADNNTQDEIDMAVYDILTAISNLKPYLKLSIVSDNGTVDVSTNAKSETNGLYSVLFGNQITLTATADDNYNFVCWYETTSNRVLSYDETYTFKITTNTSIEARFTPVQSASIYFMNDSGYIAGIVTKTIEEWKQITTIADLLPSVPYKYGGINGRWLYVESSVLRNLRKGSDVDIIATYDDISLERPTIPNAVSDSPELTLAYYLDTENSVGSFVMAAGIPDGCEIESIGIAFYYKKATTFDPTDFNVNINNKMLTSKFEASNESGYYTVDVNKFSSVYNWAVIGYMTYYSDGELKIAYSNQLNIVNRQQV